MKKVDLIELKIRNTVSVPDENDTVVFAGKPALDFFSSGRLSEREVAVKAKEYEILEYVGSSGCSSFFGIDRHDTLDAAPIIKCIIDNELEMLESIIGDQKTSMKDLEEKLYISRRRELMSIILSIVLSTMVLFLVVNSVIK